MSWDKLKMPRVVIYNSDHKVVIGDSSYVQVSSFDCKLKDDGKDEIRISFRSKSIELLSGLSLEHGSLIYIAWGYWDTGLCNSIPYIVDDVTNTYSFDGLTVEITLTDFSSPFDINGGEPEIFKGETVEKDNEGNITSRTLTVSPLDFIWGMMGDNLQFYFMYGDKKYLVKDTVIPGNGYIPDGFLWNLRQYDIHGGLFSTPQMRLLTNNQHDNTAWMGDLPDTIQDFLVTPRTIDTSPRRHITILEKLIQIMPEGPWYINRRANVFIIHNRGGFGVGTAASGMSFNFKSDFNTIISFKLKYDGKKMEDDSIDGADMNATLRQVAGVQQYNSTILALKDLWLSVKSSAPSYISSADKSTLGPNLYFGQNDKGEWVTFWGGYELTQEQAKNARELLENANKYRKYGGVESKNLYYQEGHSSYEGGGFGNVTGVGVDTPMGVMVARGGGGHVSPVLNFTGKVIQHRAKYTFYSTNPDTDRHNKFIGHSYWQLLPQGDSFWQMSNTLKDSSSKAISGTLIIKGDPSIREGITVNLYGVGYDSGTYYVSSVKHVISSTGGYKTELEICRIPKDGLSQLVQTYQRDIEKLSYEKLKEIFQWSTYMGIETRYLWVAPGDPTTLTEEQKKQISINNNDQIMVEDENGKWVKVYRDPSCTDGTRISNVYDIKYLDKVPENKTQAEALQDRQTDSAMDYEDLNNK